ncbi:hypothetical protein NCS57_00489300 [Fusarium keratoplasticum]|uniref:Uncharacterized protein n=1 Tax=Fusarium keratoplasticum TaxID=1328300 RepID=A0ACC0RA78_9HYPO|nr:hypothetical protein NCS57_00489300 [Fusarium keratoplasticum]KAI8675866.1 hypothetical protein NCS57_00489300 [Fusarium keratoplasticum]
MDKSDSTDSDLANSHCTDSALEWAMIIITIIAINVTWWLLELPLLWTHGAQMYLNSVMWQCFRSYMPCCAAMYALSYARTTQEEPYIYYIGPFYDVLNASNQDQSPSPSQSQSQSHDMTGRGENEPGSREVQPPTTRGLSRFQLIKSILIDSLSIVATGLTVNTAVHLPVGNTSGVTVSTWVYPSLPVAVIGLWLLVCGTWIRWSRRWTIWLGMLVVIAVGAALITPVAVLSPAGKKNKIWGAAIFAYVLVGLPLLASRSSALTAFPAVAIGLAGRVGGVGVGAISKAAYFPYCQLQHKAFGVIYLAVGVLGGLLAVVAWFRYIWRLDPTTNPRNKRIGNFTVYAMGEKRWGAGRRGRDQYAAPFPDRDGEGYYYQQSRVTRAY